MTEAEKFIEAKADNNDNNFTYGHILVADALIAVQLAKMEGAVMALQSAKMPLAVMLYETEILKFKQQHNLI